MPSRNARPRGLSLSLAHPWLLLLIAMEKGAGAVASALVAGLALGTDGWALNLTAGASLGAATLIVHRLLTWLGTQLTPGRTGWGITFALWTVLLAAEALGLWRQRVGRRPGAAGNGDRDPHPSLESDAAHIVGGGFGAGC